MSKKYFRLFKIIGLTIFGLVLIGWSQVRATTSTAITNTLNYSEFADTKVMPWLDKATLFFVTFIKQVGELFKQIFTIDFLNIGLKFLKGIWDFVLGIFKLFFDLLTKSFKK